MVTAISLLHLHSSTFCHQTKFFYKFCMFVSFVHRSKDLKEWYLFFCLLLHLCTPAPGCWFGQHLTEPDEWKFTEASVISCEGLTACAGGWWRVVEGGGGCLMNSSMLLGAAWVASSSRTTPIRLLTRSSETSARHSRIRRRSDWLVGHHRDIRERYQVTLKSPEAMESAVWNTIKFLELLKICSGKLGRKW